MDAEICFYNAVSSQVRLFAYIIRYKGFANSGDLTRLGCYKEEPLDVNYNIGKCMNIGKLQVRPALSYLPSVFFQSFGSYF
jgi:hypothetical protein